MSVHDYFSEISRMRLDPCSTIGCAHFVIKAGHEMCMLHRRCSVEECTNGVVNNGVCVKHGATVAICSSEGCTNQAVQGVVCIKHGAKKKEKKRCSTEGCTNQVQKGGVCKKHGAKSKERKRCSSLGCVNQARNGGVCIKHGAKAKKAVKRKTLGDDESANKKCKSKLQ